jgi:2,3-bisphosphoglycerate-independent phosphoglycerate mutase
MVVKTIIENLKDKDYRILITPDHPTPVSLRTHTDEPVPFVMAGQSIRPENFSNYCELEAASSSLYFASGLDLMKYFLNK